MSNTNFKFKVLEGPRQGDLFKIRPGLIISRSKGDINLRDSKVSSSHAVIKETSKGDLLLVDMGSSNGIIVDNMRVENVTLKEGVKILVGGTIIEVISDIEIEETSDARLSDWRVLLAKYLKKLSKLSQAPNQNILPFKPPLELLVTQGLQLDTRWLLGYGPRRIGRFSKDIILMEEDAPNVCFELFPVENGVLFKTSEPGRVRLNNTVVRENFLKSGDEIIIENTHIRVNFIQD